MEASQEPRACAEEPAEPAEPQAGADRAEPGAPGAEHADVAEDSVQKVRPNPRAQQVLDLGTHTWWALGCAAVSPQHEAD